MRLGLWGARADNRGLGVQTVEFARHMHPGRVAVVDMGRHSPVSARFDRFPGAEVVKLGEISESAIRLFLDGLEVVYGAETFYDDRLMTIAREMGVRTVLHSNYEFLSHIADPAQPRPDLFLAPSPWCFDRFPQPRALVPFPVARERLPFRRRTKVETILHVAGPGTMFDRNGTRLLLESLRWVTHPCRVVIRSQAPLSLGRRDRPRHVELVHEVADVEDYWRVYDGADALVICRRYGGLCLPLNEAASLGLPVIITDRLPESGYLPDAARVPVLRPQVLRTPVGRIEAAMANPRRLADRLNALLSQPELVGELSDASNAYAQSISWERMAEPFRAALAGERVTTG